MLELARAEPNANQHFLDRVGQELPTLTFSHLATERLRYPDFRRERDNPLTISARLDIPIYLTSSHHHFMEAALRAIGKRPHTQVYSWREGIEDLIPAEFRIDLDFEPDVHSPLVFHAHGIDDYPDSLVLTEDDHLEFLANVIQDFSKQDVIPRSVRNAMSGSLLILLGYDLHRWDLRVILQGLIKDKPRRPRSFAIQLVVEDTDHITDNDRFQDYLEKYFNEAKFDIYWDGPQSFMQSLFNVWEQT